MLSNLGFEAVWLLAGHSYLLAVAGTCFPGGGEFFMEQQFLVDQGLLFTAAPHLVGLLCTSDPSDAETST
jgi:hypothetical protein